MKNRISEPFDGDRSDLQKAAAAPDRLLRRVDVNQRRGQPEHPSAFAVMLRYDATMLLHLRKQELAQAVYWLTALAFLLRLGARLYMGSAKYFESGYSFFFDIAQSIAAGNGISPYGVPTAFRVPLYPILLAGLTLGHKAFWPVAISQSLIGAGTAFSAGLLAYQTFGERLGAKTATLATGITAIYPYYVVHDTALQETSLFTLLTLLAVIVVQRSARTGELNSAALGGLLLGLDVLTRATIAPFAALSPFWLIGRRRTGAGLLCALILALTVSPWLWRSYKLTGVPTLSTETGAQLWAGNNGFLFRHYPEDSSDISKEDAMNALSARDREELDRREYNEALTDRWFLHRALSYIRSHPWSTVRDDLRKVGAAFGWLPSARKSMMPNLVHAFSYGPVMLLGLWGMWRRRSRWREDSLLYALFAVFVLVTAVFFGDTSHRSFLDVYWIVFGAGALVSAIAPVG